MKSNLVTLVFLILSINIHAQVSINNDGSSPDASAVLDVKSTVSGVLLPRMTTGQILAIISPAEGLLVYNTETKSFWFFNGTLWKSTISGFICGDQVLDADGNVYNTVLIGTQCWMKENLKTTTYSDGTPIPNVTDNTAWSALTTGAYAWYDNDISWKDKYGALYNWYSTADTYYLCPAGWHVPSHTEWAVLVDYIGGSAAPHGNESKSCRQVNSPLGGNCNTVEHPRWDEHATEYGTDIYGFSGLPGGWRVNDGTFNYLGQRLYMWSSTSYGGGVYGRNRYIWYNYGGFYDVYFIKAYGQSVRCLKDN